MRKLGLCALSLCLLFSMTACGDKKTDDKTETTVAESTTEATSDAGSEASTDAAKKDSKDTTEKAKDDKADSKTESKSEKTEATTEATTAAAPVAEETPTEVQSTGKTVTLYYQDGSTETLSEETDGTYVASNGARYYLGEDGVYRARGYEDLYTSMPEVSGSSVKTVTAFYSNGTTESLTQQSDGTWQAPNGASYTLGDDGTYHADGFQDLYSTNPAQ